MSDSITPSLQFDRAEFDEAAPSRVVCTLCNGDVRQAYYEIGGRIICNDCREAREQAHQGLGIGRFLRAAAAGAVIAIAGATVWWAVRRFLNLKIGIISIFIGIGVAKAIMWGTHGKGGWLYQILAMFLTYSAVALNYTPDLMTQMATENPGIPAWLSFPISFIVGYLVPFDNPAGNIIGLLIIAFGLFEAWKLTKRVDDGVTGPYAVTPAALAPPAPSNV